MRKILSLLLLISFTACSGQFYLPTALVLPVSTAFTPPTLNIEGHYDASIASSVTIATGVSQWADQSGLTHHLIQATTTKQPTYTGTGTSSMITFNGSTFSLSATFTFPQPVTYYLVAKQITWTSNNIIMDGTTNNTMMLRQATSSPMVYLYAGSGFPTISGWTLTVVMVVTGVVNGASSSISINDGAKVTSSQVGAAAPGGFVLGAAAFGANANVGVQELYIYNDAHSAATQTSMVAYLRSKWGI